MLDFEKLDHSNYDTITIQLNDYLLGPLLIRYNSDYATESLYHLPAEEDAEDKPEKIRGRIGLLIEYALISILHEMVEEDTNRRCAVTFNTANMFADFFIRSDVKPVLRVDIKAFHRESDEASARFDARVDDIDPNRDYLLVARGGNGVTLFPRCMVSWFDIRRSRMHYSCHAKGLQKKGTSDRGRLPEDLTVTVGHYLRAVPLIRISEN